MDPFVREVIRIIKESTPGKWGKHTIVLVSRRFYNAAIKEIERQNVFGKLAEYPHNQILVVGILIFPVWWLSDYEFEIRPPVLKGNYTE